MTADTCTAIVLHPTLANNEDVETAHKKSKDNTSNSTSQNGSRYRGLSNQGATCYLNSLLQSLYMTPEFRSALYSWKYDEEKDGPESECIPFQLQSLFGQMQLSKQGALTTESLTKSFGWGNAEAFQQQDVQELCRVLFDRLEEAFKGTANANLVNELYQGGMVDYLETIGYDYESKRPTEFLDISLQVKAFGSDKAFSSVEESLRSFLAPEKLEGENQYFCEEANEKMDAIKGFRLEKLPYVLTLQLKRFDLDYTTFQRIKLNDQVRFPRVLNMNAYLGKVKKTDNEATDQSEEGDEESSSSSSSQDNVSKNESNQEFESYMAQERLRLKEASSTSNEGKGGDESDDDLELPDLVDVCGNKAPSQVAEEEAKKLAIKNATFPEDQDIDPAELVKSQGEWVYELYAVLIHSGSALGGHYYAYIKNMAEQKWFKFNDSTVTEVDSFAPIRDAWGGKTSTYTSSSGANAYMLMYRKYDPSRNQAEPTVESIPQYIKDKAEQVEREALEKQELQKMRARQLEIKVSLGGPALGDKEVSVSHDKEADLKSLKIAAAQAFGIKVKGYGDVVIATEAMSDDDDVPPLLDDDDDPPPPLEGDETQPPQPPSDLLSPISPVVATPLTGDDGETGDSMVQAEVLDATQCYVKSINERWPEGVDEADIRMREYNFTYKILVKAYDSEEKSLAEHKLVNYKKVGLEIKSERGFDEVISESSFIRLTWYDPSLPSKGAGDGVNPPEPGSFREPVAVFYSPDWNIGQFREKAAQQLDILPSQCRLMKMSTYSTMATIFYDNDEATLKSLYWYEGSQIWAEKVPERIDPTQEWPPTIKSQQCFDDESSKATILVSNIDHDECLNLVDIDLRWTVKTLRLVLIKYFNLNNNNNENDNNDNKLTPFRIKQTGGRECKDDNKILRSEGFYKSMKLLLSSGTPPTSNQFYVKCYLLTIPGAKSGLKPLPTTSTSSTSTEQMEQDPPMNSAVSDSVSTEQLKVEASEEAKGPTEAIKSTNDKDTSGGDSGAAAAEEVESDDLDCFVDMNIQEPAQASDFDQFPMEILVSTDTPIIEVRKLVKTHLISRGLMEDQSDLNLIRLREKQAYRGGKIARNGFTFNETFNSLFDGKEIAVTLLDEPEDLLIASTSLPVTISNDDKNDDNGGDTVGAVGDSNGSTSSNSVSHYPHHQSSALVWVVRWYRDTYTLGEKFECLIKFNDLLSHTNERLAKLTDIKTSLSNVRILRVVPYTTLKLSDLQKKTHAMTLGQAGWQNFYHYSNEHKEALTKEAQLNLLELSSDLLIVQDISEPIKQFASPPPSSSTSTYASVLSSSSASSSSSSSSGSNSSSINKKSPYVKPKETGIRIKTRQDRAAEKEACSNNSINLVDLSAQSDADIWDDDDEPPPLIAIGEEEEAFQYSCMNDLD